MKNPTILSIKSRETIHEIMNDVKFDRIMRAGDSILTVLKIIRRPHYANLATD